MRHSEYMKLQVDEIEKHKWIESEKAGRDVGEDACIDWILKHAKGFREHVEKCECIQFGKDCSRSLQDS